ncbi:MAG: ImmA/IrrE family metallo-endopeptidase [candidate division Zixibacteria bacterium]|nr:ImmA/IrrE family metallo-endopeptidase [candidate division Zixibacteria bacterium]
MSRTTFAEINNSILRWARESSGLDLESAAKKVNTSIEKLRHWEEGETFPTMKQLRKLSKVYMRPIGMFFLPELPEEAERIKDFRRIPEVMQEEMSSALRFEIRLAFDRREEAIDLAADLGDEISTITLPINLHDDTDQVARRIRDTLGVSIAEQFSWRSKRQAFNTWRSSLENLGVLIFQTGILRNLVVKPQEARGFSISDQPFPVIVANSKDHAAARCFTLIHEFVHILLRDGGLCDLHNPFSARTDSERTEVFSNRVAGAVLVPRDELLNHEVVRNHGQNPEWTNDELSQLSRAFWVSSEVILRRLLILNKTTRDFYQAWRTETNDQYPGTDDRGEPKISTPTRVIIKNGKLFPRLVIRALKSKYITTFEASELLSAGPHRITDVESVVF